MMKLTGMADALTSQLQMPEALTLSFDERIGLLVDAENTMRENRRLQTRLRDAKLTEPACIEDIDWCANRTLERSTFSTLATLQWIRFRQNLLITGETGTGKSYLAMALAQKACRDGFTSRVERAPRLFKQLAEARVTGEFEKLSSSLARTNLLVIDDLGLKSLTVDERHDLLELMEDRYEKQSTIVTSQLPVNHWHEIIGDPTIADAILDRLVHNAHRLSLQGESIRKRKSDLKQP